MKFCPDCGSRDLEMQPLGHVKCPNGHFLSSLQVQDDTKWHFKVIHGSTCAIFTPDGRLAAESVRYSDAYILVQAVNCYGE